MTHDVAMSRRDLRTAGGARIVAGGLRPQARLARAAATGQPLGSLATAAGLEAWIRIHADGTVMVGTGTVEIGQGMTTALAHVVAEALDVALDRLRLVTLEGSGCYGQNGADDAAADAALLARVLPGRLVRVLRVVAADDAGERVHPAGVRHPIAGGIVQTTSGTRTEAVRCDRTRLTSRDWSSDPLLTCPEGPAAVAVGLVDRPGPPCLGTGEAAQGPTVAALAHAVATATRVCIRELPLTPARVLAALQPATAQPSSATHPASVAPDSGSGSSSGSAPATGSGTSR